MTSFLDKSSANALLFLLGISLGGVQDRPKSPAPSEPNTAACSLTSSPNRSSPPEKLLARPGVESEELAALRRADAELFVDLNLDSAPQPNNAHRYSCSCDDSAPRRAFGLNRRPLRGARDDSGFWNNLKTGGLPIAHEEKIERYVRFFTQNRNGRTMFMSWLRRSGKFRDLVGEAFKKQKLPQDLIAVAFIESGLMPTAISPAGATGMWQFMRQTGQAYGLVVEPSFDQRRSIPASTDAAARHLADLYAYFSSWELALAAYNLGYKGLSKRIEQLGTDNFWELSDIPDALPKETALYVPKVLAVALILNNLETFGFDQIKLDAPMEASELEVPSGTRLSLVARASGTSLAEIRTLNPEFTAKLTPKLTSSQKLLVPAKGVARARVMLPSLIHNADTDDSDLKVSATFDWGHDEFSGEPGNKTASSGAYFSRDKVEQPELAQESDQSSSDDSLLVCQSLEPLPQPHADPPSVARIPSHYNRRPDLGHDDGAKRLAFTNLKRPDGETRVESASFPERRKTVSLKQNRSKKSRGKRK